MQRLSRTVLSAFILVALMGGTVYAADKPIALHPENPHYFTWRGEPTILITSGEHYGALMNLDFDYVRYFDELKAHGLNHTRTFTGVYREDSQAFNITDNTLAPKPNRYICHWARSDQPGYGNGGNKFDLRKWDPAYFKRLRDFMTKANERGVVVDPNVAKLTPPANISKSLPPFTGGVGGGHLDRTAGAFLLRSS